MKKYKIWEISRFAAQQSCSNMLNHKGLAKENLGQVLSQPLLAQTKF